MTVAFLVTLSLGAHVGCGSDERSTSAGPPRPTDDKHYPTQLADYLDCVELEPVNDMIMPLRSLAARAVISCGLDEATLHIFERDTPYPNYPDAGSVASIDFALNSLGFDPRCQTWVLIGEDWFVVADDQAVLADVEDALGGAVRPIRSVSPVVSYPGAPGCDFGP